MNPRREQNRSFTGIFPVFNSIRPSPTRFNHGHFLSSKRPWWLARGTSPPPQFVNVEQWTSFFKAVKQRLYVHALYVPFDHPRSLGRTSSLSLWSRMPGFHVNSLMMLVTWKSCRELVIHHSPPTYPAHFSHDMSFLHRLAVQCQEALWLCVCCV